MRAKRNQIAEDEMQRSSIAAGSARGPKRRAAEHVASENDDDRNVEGHGSVRRSVRLSGRAPELVVSGTPPKSVARKPLADIGRASVGSRRSLRLTGAPMPAAVDAEQMMQTPPRIRARREEKQREEERDARAKVEQEQQEAERVKVALYERVCV